MKYRGLQTFIFVLALTPLAAAQDLASFEKRVTVKALPNGLTVIICSRPEAPVFSFYTHVDAGSVQDPMGETGLAHMFEHMAFKGTDKIGTKNYPAEKVALAKVEKIYAAYIDERDKPVGRDDKKVKALKKEWQGAIKDAQQYVVEGAFDEILERNGAQGVNASTNDDETNYFYSLPQNRLELWAYLESERFLHPVMREFYKERDVVIEERRLRTDSNPVGRLVEQFLSAAYQAHPYHRPTVGWMSDLNTFSASDAQKFFDEYYIPSNMVVTVAGDVKASEAMPMIEKYFARIPSHEKPDERTTTEPAQNSERRVVLREAAQPLYLEGYHRPDYRSPDDAVYDAIVDLMSRAALPGCTEPSSATRKSPLPPRVSPDSPVTSIRNCSPFYAFLMPGHKPEEAATAIHAEMDKLKTEDISDDELKMIKTRAKANLIRGLADNEGLAQQLGIYQARYGDWRELFRQVDRIDKVSKADIRRVANQVFVATNRTVGIIETASPASANRGGAQ